MKLTKKMKEIISGWSNFIDKSEVTEKEAIRRASICDLCPHSKKSILLSFVKDELKEVEGMYCDDCGCPLSAKVRTKENSCDKWRVGTK